MLSRGAWVAQKGHAGSWLPLNKKTIIDLNTYVASSKRNHRTTVSQTFTKCTNEVWLSIPFPHRPIPRNGEFSNSLIQQILFIPCWWRLYVICMLLKSLYVIEDGCLHPMKQTNKQTKKKIGKWKFQCECWVSGTHCWHGSPWLVLTSMTSRWKFWPNSGWSEFGARSTQRTKHKWLHCKPFSCSKSEISFKEATLHLLNHYKFPWGFLNRSVS